jgi:D-lactate dehydrogenase
VNLACAFVNDRLNGAVLEAPVSGGTRLVALRSAGFNHVDLDAARRLGLTVARVPAYSPYAVAEHTVALILALNRKIFRAHYRVREGNFALDGPLGFDLHGRTWVSSARGNLKRWSRVRWWRSGAVCSGTTSGPSDECLALGLT